MGGSLCMFKKIRNIFFTRPLDCSPGETPFFSFLVTVYHKTNKNEFEEMIISLASSGSKSFEVIVLAHGSVSLSLKEYLLALPKNHFRIHFLDENIGIIRGMSFCLKQSKGKYIIPVDADDWMEKGFLRNVRNFLDNNNYPDYIYTDEYIALASGKKIRYSRKNWDPILSSYSSYVWHLTCFKREVALDLGIYSDSNSEYCHDWDTISLFWQNQKKIMHLPEALYNWRQHQNSSTNNTSIQSRAALNSQKNVLEKMQAYWNQNSHSEVREFPIFRGAIEYYSALTNISREDFQWIKFSSFNQLITGLDTKIEPYCIFSFEDFKIVFEKNFYEEIQSVFTRFNEVCVLTSEICNGDKIIESGYYLDKKLKWTPVNKGKKSTDPGPMALFLKPHTIDVPNPYFFITKRSLISDFLEMEGEKTVNKLWEFISNYSRENKLRVVTHPLLRGTTSVERSTFKVKHLIKVKRYQ